MYDNTTDEFCSFDATGNSNAGACAAPKSCTDYTLVANTNTNTATCAALRDKTGPKCQIVDPVADTTCSITTGAAICTSVSSPASLEVC